MKDDGITLRWVTLIRNLRKKGKTDTEIVERLFAYGCEEEARITKTFKDMESKRLGRES